MWVRSTEVEVESAWRKTWNWVPVSGLIRAVSMIAGLSGGWALMKSALVSGVTNSTTTLGVTNLTILYGVNTGSAVGNNVDTYLTADLMTAANWSNVISVMVQLAFTNPLYTAGSTTQPQQITIQRIVGVMNQLGPVE